ncbi:charged multivesicular body protein 2b [Antrostomus carolinensis]|uniref:charged multivesicular body protein 2b n=1 Tax=Antrostomus carolinensis TaxID=279965 RepID=UPI000528BB0D|nr:charged multivesicular body protein 2b [Antrostomus carolinensis]
MQPKTLKPNPEMAFSRVKPEEIAYLTAVLGHRSALRVRVPQVWLAAAPELTLSGMLDIIKEQNRELRGTQRAITRDRAALEKQEKQLELEIKKMAKTGNKEACKVLAKQLVQLRKQKNRTYAVSSKVTSMSTQTKVMNSQMKMAGAMSTTAKTMQAVNKKMDPQKTLQTMQNFQKENMKMEMTEEMINDTLDDIFDASDEEEESQDIVNQVLDEIGIEISGKMAKAPSAARGLPSASTSKAATISDEEIERQLKALGVD